MTAEISIIVPVYNAQETLQRCIDSILAQSFSDFELLLIDDGSNDSSLDICLKYAADDARIRVFHHENAGVSAARNRGIENASGKFLMFCDSDDYPAENWCGILLDTIQKNEDAWVVSNAFRVDESGESSTIDDLRRHPESVTYADIYLKYLSAYLWNKIYNADIIRENGIRFCPDVEMGEDVLFNIEYYKFCSSVTYIPEPLYYYCDNADSAMQKYRPNKFELDTRLFRARLPLIKEDELPDFCNHYLYFFVTLLDVVFDERNTSMNRAQKIKYNKNIMNSEEFRFCAEHASGENESALYMKVLRTHNYTIFRIFKKLVALKNTTGPYGPQSPAQFHGPDLNEEK